MSVGAAAAAGSHHRLIVAEAAKYDNHPHPVVPMSPLPSSSSHNIYHKNANNRLNHHNNRSGNRSQFVVEEDEARVHSSVGPTKTSKEVQQRFTNATNRNKMERGISKASENEYIINQARNHVENQFQGSPDSPDGSGGNNGCGNNLFSVTNGGGGGRGFIDTPIYTFTLPDLTVYPEDYRGFLEKDLIELSSLISLEQSGRLNWWAETGTCQRLWPLATTGDGNCLLHAASLGMWGFHDRLLTLRKALHAFLSTGVSAPSLYRRWRWQCHQQNLQYGLTLSEKEWQEEWGSVLRLASSEPRHGSSSSSSEDSSCMSTLSSTSSSTNSVAKAGNSRRWSRLSFAAEGGGGGGGCSTSAAAAAAAPCTLYESLEEIHVLALAHVLRRTIIVVADTVLRDMNGDALAPIPFGGVYLPLECSPSECHRSPLLLTYNAGHFSALVSMQSNRQEEYAAWLPAVIPLTDSTHSLLPLHFALDPGESFSWNKDEFDQETTAKMTLHPTDQLDLLTCYLEVVKVTLPEWCLDDPQQQPQQPQQQQQQDVVDSSAECGSIGSNNGNNNSSSKASRQANSVAKQFGSIGKKLRRNLGKLARSSSFKGCRQDTTVGSASPAAMRHQQQSASSAAASAVSSSTSSAVSAQKSIVSGSQDFILSAVIHTNQPLPYQNEMVENYLEEARQRFQLDKDLKVRQRDEQRELDEKRRREIYLNGGYIDCITPGCDGQGTLASNYLCPPCNTVRLQQQQQQGYIANSAVICHGNSRFYLPSNAAHGIDRHDEVDETAAVTTPEESPSSSSVEDKQLRVILPPPIAAAATVVNDKSGATNSCRSVGCDFYGNPEFDHFCSKCYSKMVGGSVRRARPKT